jgi:hypothetical protein
MDHTLSRSFRVGGPRDAFMNVLDGLQIGVEVDRTYRLHLYVRI